MTRRRCARRLPRSRPTAAARPSAWGRCTRCGLASRRRERTPNQYSAHTHGGATMSIRNDSAEAEVRRHNEPGDAANETWPALPLAAWQGTYQTLHMWTQIVGKVRLALSPPVNHWWAVTLHVTPRGLTNAPLSHCRRTLAVTL